jgi:two-component system, cell cycle sensor histidine kinase and response regulator CckA
MEALLRRIIGEDVELITKLDASLGHIRADPNQLSQVILNLAANARDAMPTGGRLLIETANVQIDDSYVERHGLPRAGPHVLLAVSDTGVGMDKETVERIFEPFFTTKARGQGTGLGLSSVYGIVKQSGGDIWAYSEPGLGTTFKVYLPQENTAVVPLETAEPTQVPDGVETVLVVEDESAVRALVCAALEQHGYTVLQATGGDAALQVSSAHPGPIDLVVTDLVMPGMSGRQLAGQLSQVRPQARVLYMSGYTDDVALRHGLVDRTVPYLQKPFTPAALAQKVREVLDQSRA